MATTTRFAVAGLTHPHTQGWLRTLEQFGNVDLCGYYDEDIAAADRLADLRRPAPFYTDLAALLRERRPDALLVTLPNRAAAAAAQQAARAGVHVLADKPMARTAAEAAACVQAARAAGVQLAVGFTNRLDPAVQALQAQLAAGRLGRLYSMEALLAVSQVEQRGADHWTFARAEAGGGILHWLGIHLVDLLLWLAAEPVTAVAAMTANVSGAPIDVEDAASLTLRFASGALGVLHCGYFLPFEPKENYLAIRGQAGSARLSPMGSDRALHLIGADPTGVAATQVLTPTRRSVPGYGGANGHAFVAGFLGSLAGGPPPAATGADAWRALTLIEAAYAAAASGCTVPLPEPIE